MNLVPLQTGAMVNFAALFGGSDRLSLAFCCYYGNFGGSAMLTPSCGDSELHKF
jgi:hypothetical protein